MSTAETIEIEEPSVIRGGELSPEILTVKPEAHLERETARQHWMRCGGCLQCWPEVIERESDI